MKLNVIKKHPLLTKMILSAAVMAGTAGISFGQPFQIGAAAGRGAGAGAGAGGGGRGGGVAQAPVNASSDARTNTVVISGPADQMDQILEIINKIDENPAIDNVVYVYKLKNGSALNVEAVANLLFSGTGGNNRGVTAQQTLGTGRLNSTTGGGGAAGGRAGGQRAGAGGGGLGGGGAAAGGRAGGVGGGVATAGGVAGQGGAAAGLAGQVSVIADPNTNSLLISTNPSNWPRVKLILDELDRSVPQVLIKVLIAEVTHDNTTDIGADLEFFNVRLDSSGALTEGQRTGSIFNTPGFDNGGRGGILQIAESQFSATIRALQATGKLDVLSRPYILASDNQLASINIGQQVPYVTGSVTDANGGITNAVAYAQVGVLLDVIPHINPDGMVILDVSPEVSALLDSRIQISADVSAPVFSTRTAQTRVAVENGQTVVIGGLMQDQKNSTVSKVPILGDIPWIGPLFQSRHENKSKTELLIFMTPHVAQRPDMLQAMGDEELNHTKLTPNAVSPGEFQEHLQGLKSGATPPASQPTVLEEPHELMPSDQQLRQQEQQRQQQNGTPGRGGLRGGGAGGGGGRGFGPPAAPIGPGPGVPPPIEGPGGLGGQ